MRAWYTDASGLHADLCQYPQQETTRLIMRRSGKTIFIREYRTWSDAIDAVLASGSGWTSDLTEKALACSLHNDKNSIIMELNLKEVYPMTTRCLALYMIEHSDKPQPEIDLARAADIIGMLDPAAGLPNDLTPETFMDAWNEIIRESAYEDNWTDHTQQEAATAKRISIDNGHSFCDPEDALREYSMETIVAYMDDDTREKVHAELVPCSDIEFLTRYLELAPYDLIIG